MTQTHWVIERLRQQWPNLNIQIEQIRTTGDRVTNQPLSQIGGDGVFVTEIERALHERRIDIAVHSLKDLPTAQPDNLRVVVTGPREDVRDVLISNGEVAVTEQGIQHALRVPRIGTCSLRRTAQLRVLAPEAEILPLRGNVDTRLRKLEAGEYDAIILASAGLHRLELQQRLGDRVNDFPIAMMMPAPGQGALAIETRDEPELLALLAPLKDVVVQAAVSAERMFMRRLGAGCYLPVAAYGSVFAQQLHLQGLVISLDGQRRILVEQHMPWTPEKGVEYAEQLGVSLAEEALQQGASQIIREISEKREQEQRV